MLLYVHSITWWSSMTDYIISIGSTNVIPAICYFEFFMKIWLINTLGSILRLILKENKHFIGYSINLWIPLISPNRLVSYSHFSPLNMLDTMKMNLHEEIIVSVMLIKQVLMCKWSNLLNPVQKFSYFHSRRQFCKTNCWNSVYIKYTLFLLWIIFIVLHYN